MPTPLRVGDQLYYTRNPPTGGIGSFQHRSSTGEFIEHVYLANVNPTHSVSVTDFAEYRGSVYLIAIDQFFPATQKIQEYNSSLQFVRDVVPDVTQNPDDISINSLLFYNIAIDAQGRIYCATGSTGSFAANTQYVRVWRYNNDGSFDRYFIVGPTGTNNTSVFTLRLDRTDDNILYVLVVTGGTLALIAWDVVNDVLISKTLNVVPSASFGTNVEQDVDYSGNFLIVNRAAAGQATSFIDKRNHNGALLSSYTVPRPADWLELVTVRADCVDDNVWLVYNNTASLPFVYKADLVAGTILVPPKQITLVGATDPVEAVLIYSPCGLILYPSPLLITVSFPTIRWPNRARRVAQATLIGAN